MGGIDSEEIKRYSDIQTLKESGLLGILRKGGIAPEELQMKLRDEGEIIIPPRGVDPFQHILDLLKKKVKTAEAFEDDIGRQYREFYKTEEEAIAEEIDDAKRQGTGIT